MHKLVFVTMTDSGNSREVEFPLHQETGSTQDLSALVTELLNTISKHVEKCDSPKDGDILQALTMVSAIRCGLVNVDPKVSKQLFSQMFDNNFDAFINSRPMISGRA